MELNLEGISSVLRETIAVALEAGKLMRDEGLSQIFEKEGHANFVTNMDLKVQQYAIQRLQPLIEGALFLAEEDEDPVEPEDYCWIIDPIDGTTNFITDYRHSCISIGLIRGGEGVLGVIYDPYLDEVFYAERGAGAYCNGKRLKVSERPEKQAVIGFGTSPYHPDLCELSFKSAAKCMAAFADIRRSGSAALDLAYVAAGRTDGFFEWILQPWDFAAGAVIIKEAGGSCKTLDAEGWSFIHPISICAASPRTEEALTRLLWEVRA